MKLKGWWRVWDSNPQIANFEFARYALFYVTRHIIQLTLFGMELIIPHCFSCLCISTEHPQLHMGMPYPDLLHYILYTINTKNARVKHKNLSLFLVFLCFLLLFDLFLQFYISSRFFLCTYNRFNIIIIHFILFFFILFINPCVQFS